MKELTLDEKVSLMGNTSPEVKRLNIPLYQWWSEALHGVAYSPGVDFRQPTPYWLNTLCNVDSPRFSLR